MIATIQVLVTSLEKTHGPSRVLSLAVSLGGARLIADLFAKFASHPPDWDEGEGRFGLPRPQ